MLHDWIYLEDNTWLRELLPDELFTRLEFDTKISQGKFAELCASVHDPEHEHLRDVSGVVLDLIMLLILLAK